MATGEKRDSLDTLRKVRDDSFRLQRMDVWNFNNRVPSLEKSAVGFTRYGLVWTKLMSLNLKRCKGIPKMNSDKFQVTESMGQYTAYELLTGSTIVTFVHFKTKPLL